jgi:transcriptional regulator with XRE-family HTH domain
MNFSRNVSFLTMLNRFDSEIASIGIKIKKIRQEKNITQSLLASLCDIDIRTIQRIEKGKYNMTLKILFSISESLDVDLCELLKK